MKKKSSMKFLKAVLITVCMTGVLFVSGCRSDRIRDELVPYKSSEPESETNDPIQISPASTPDIEKTKELIDEISVLELKKKEEIFVIYNGADGIDNIRTRSDGGLEITDSDEYVLSEGCKMQSMTWSEFINYIKKARDEKGVTEVYYHKYSEAMAESMGKPSFMGSTIKISSLLGETSSDTKEIKEYQKGMRVAGGYESKFLDLRFNTPNGWALRTDEEIKEIFGDSDPDDVVELSAINLSTNENLHVCVEEVPTKNAKLEQYKSVLKSNFERDGLKFVGDKESIEIAGKTYEVMEFDIDYSGQIVKTELWIRLQEDRIVYIMMQYRDGNRKNMDSVLNAFEKY